MSGPGDVAGYQRQLEQAIQEKGLQAFYGPGTPGAQRLPQIAQRAAQSVDRLCQAWRIQKEIANDIVRLALYGKSQRFNSSLVQVYNCIARH